MVRPQWCTPACAEANGPSASHVGQPSRRGQCGQANERDIGLVVVTSRSVVIGARGEAPVGQHALCADPIQLSFEAHGLGTCPSGLKAQTLDGLGALGDHAPSAEFCNSPAAAWTDAHEERAALAASRPGSQNPTAPASDRAPAALLAPLFKPTSPADGEPGLDQPCAARRGRVERLAGRHRPGFAGRRRRWTNPRRQGAGPEGTKILRSTP
jgi:hypothetical protein